MDSTDLNMQTEHGAVRRWYVSKALESWKALQEVINALTVAEVLYALDLESESRRRRVIVDRLLSRAVRLNELTYSKTLKEKYYGKSQFRHSVPR